MKRYSFELDQLSQELYDLRHVKKVTRAYAMKTGEPVYITLDRGPGSSMAWYVMHPDGRLTCDAKNISFNN